MSGTAQAAPARAAAIGRVSGGRLLHGLGLVLILIWPIRVGYLSLSLLSDWQAIDSIARSGQRRWPEIQAVVGRTRSDLTAWRTEVAPLVWLLSLSRPLPIVGPDLASAGPLLDLAAEGAIVADELLGVAGPALNRTDEDGLLPALAADIAAHPAQLAQARSAMERLAAARESIPADVSPLLQNQLSRLDPFLPLLHQIVVFLSMPNALGDRGPQTYLLVAQNADELRATGGFISSVGIVTFDRGELTFRVESAYALDNFDQSPYPLAPEPLYRYMGAQLWLLRDGNWEADFPSAARTIAGLYTLGQGQAVAGVIAFDQTTLQYLLEATGPLELDDGATAVTAGSLMDFMRLAWTPEPGDLDPDARTESDLALRQLGEALLKRLLAEPESLDPVALTRALARAFNEKHLLAAMPDAALAASLARYGWDGSLQPASVDHLYVVDSNVGFNKVDASVERTIHYAVDLSDLSRPIAHLRVHYLNPGPAANFCPQIDNTYGEEDYASLTVGCYWNYLRIYIPAAARLQIARPIPTPGEWMWDGRADSGEVTASASAVGLLELSQFFVVPSGSEQVVALTYALPPDVITHDAALYTYCLQIIKQPGTAGDQVELSLALPDFARVHQPIPSPAGIDENGLVTASFTLKSDRQFCFAFDT